jgi:type VI secretion system protein VasG
MGLNLRSLLAKLNSPTRSALEAAAGLCLSRTHYDVEIEHYLLKLLDAGDNDFARIAQQFGVDKSRLTVELTRNLDSLKSGNARTPAFSPAILKMLTEAWTIGSIDFNASQIRSGFTILALLVNDELARLVRETSKEFQKIQTDALRKDLQSIYRANSNCRRARPCRWQDPEPRSIHRKPNGERSPRQDRPGSGKRL